MAPRRSVRRFLHWHLLLAALLSPSPQSFAQTSASPSRLQQLVNDTAAQFQLAYRRDPAERQRREQQLAAVIKAWRTAERGDTNNRLLTEWLRTAMRSSMPGSSAELPPIPKFAGGTIDAGSAAAMSAPKAPPMMDDKSAGDPFRDDAADESEL